MQNIIEVLSSPLWWFTVVVVGIIVNLLASYMKSKLDVFFGGISKWWLNKSNERKALSQALFLELKESDNKRFMLSFLAHRSMQHSIHFLVMALFVILIILLLDVTTGSKGLEIIKIITFGFSSILFIISFLSFTDSTKKRILLFKVLNELDTDKGLNEYKVS